MTGEEFLALEHERVAKRVTLTVVSINLLRWLGGLSSIPEELVSTVRTSLDKAKQEAVIRDFRVYACASDLLVHVTSLGQGLWSPPIYQAVYQSVNNALSFASEAGMYRPITGQDFFAMPPAERIAALKMRPVELPFTERGAEPILVAKIIGL